MAVRQIRIMGDDILTKKCKPVKEMTGRTMELIEDMFETMYEANGCGLAAPQVGVLKQIVIIDVDDGNQYVMINPEIIGQEGSQTGYEGCLSLPGKSGIVTRPNYVKVKALDENMEPYELEGEGLLARAICHEVAHRRARCMWNWWKGSWWTPALSLRKGLLSRNVYYRVLQI